jgi:hypothetical protein
MTSRYDELSTLMTQDDNYARYRSELGTFAPDVFCVPFIGMHCGSVQAWPRCRPVCARGWIDAVVYVESVGNAHSSPALGLYLTDLTYTADALKDQPALCAAKVSSGHGHAPINNPSPPSRAGPAFCTTWSDMLMKLIGREFISANQQ